MGINFGQSDLVASCGAMSVCSGIGLATLTRTTRMTAGSPPGGSIEWSITIPNKTTKAGVMFQPSVMPDVRWKAGYWNIDLNVTTASQDGITWWGTYVCRINSCTSVATIASLTGQTDSIDSTGIKRHSVLQAADLPDTDAGDEFYIVLVFKNDKPTGPSPTFKITMDQQIFTPLEYASTTYIKGGNIQGCILAP